VIKPSCYIICDSCGRALAIDLHEMGRDETVQHRAIMQAEITGWRIVDDKTCEALCPVCLIKIGSSEASESKKRKGEKR